jgi:hypothetical protein
MMQLHLRTIKIMHDDISLARLVIPGLTRNPVFFWIPAGVYPVLDTGQECPPFLRFMTLCIVFAEGLILLIRY